MQSVIDLWQRIDQWLATHAPRVLEQLNPGASEADIAKAEATLGFALPEDFKASYRIHNGGGAYPLGLLEGMQGGSLDPLHDVVSRWLSIQEQEIYDDPPDFVTNPERKCPPVQPVAWHPRWLIFAIDTAGNFRCLDLAPAAGGQVGQIFEYEHGVGPTLVIAPSLEALLTQWADWLETGDIYYQIDEYGGEGFAATQDWCNEWMMLRDRPKWEV
jgi:cell wall assembly regulator SMI1